MTIVTSLAALVVCVAPEPALATTPDQTPPIADGALTPKWLRTPDADAFARYYPPQAAHLGIGGRAVVHCRVSAAGTLVDCAIVEEDPPGYGFGEAVLKMMPMFKMRPMVVNGVATDGGEINIPIRFNPPPPRSKP
jgi:protein TonB